MKNLLILLALFVVSCGGNGGDDTSSLESEHARLLELLDTKLEHHDEHTEITQNLLDVAVAIHADTVTAEENEMLHEEHFSLHHDLHQQHMDETTLVTADIIATLERMIGLHPDSQPLVLAKEEAASVPASIDEHVAAVQTAGDEYEATMQELVNQAQNVGGGDVNSAGKTELETMLELSFKAAAAEQKKDVTIGAVAATTNKRAQQAKSGQVAE